MREAQALGKPGENAPTDDPAWKSYFWVPLATVMGKCEYTSNDSKYFKTNLEELMDVRVISEGADGWATEVLLAGVAILNSRGPNPRGGGAGTMWLGFTFPPQVYQTIMNPTRYTNFNLFYQTQLSSNVSLALYEICRRYATNPSHVTDICDWETWYEVLVGDSKSGKQMEFKAFNRTCLKPAVAEVNARTDILVEPIYEKNGRTIKRIQFIVRFKEQKPFVLPTSPVDEEMVNKLVSIRISRATGEELSASYSSEKLTAALLAVTDRLKTNKTPVANIETYFRAVLKNVTVGESKPASTSKVHKPVYTPTIKGRYLSHRAENAIELFLERSSTEQDEVFNAFSQTKEGTFFSKDRILRNQTTKAALGLWYAKDMWGDPTVDDLDNFERNSDMQVS